MIKMYYMKKITHKNYFTHGSFSSFIWFLSWFWVGIKGRTEIATQGAEQRTLLRNRSAEVNSHRPPLEIPPEEAPTTAPLGISKTREYHQAQGHSLHPKKSSSTTCPPESNLNSQTNSEKQEKEIGSLWPHWEEAERGPVTTSSPLQKPKVELKFKQRAMEHTHLSSPGQSVVTPTTDKSLSGLHSVSSREAV